MKNLCNMQYAVKVRSHFAPFLKVALVLHSTALLLNCASLRKFSFRFEHTNEFTVVSQQVKSLCYCN
jgi:hypothetical protein